MTDFEKRKIDYYWKAKLSKDRVLAKDECRRELRNIISKMFKKHEAHMINQKLFYNHIHTIDDLCRLPDDDIECLYNVGPVYSEKIKRLKQVIESSNF